MLEEASLLPADTGQQIHAMNLVTMWEEYLDFDTHHDGPGSTIKKLLSNTSTGTRPGRPHPGRISGMACVSNFGSFANWVRAFVECHVMNR